jgi:hypothetical protein
MMDFLSLFSNSQRTGSKTPRRQPQIHAAVYVTAFLFALAVLASCARGTDTSNASDSAGGSVPLDTTTTTISQDEIALSLLVSECRALTDKEFPPHLWYENKIPSAQKMFSCHYAAAKSARPSTSQWMELCSQLPESGIRFGCTQEFANGGKQIPIDQYLASIEKSLKSSGTTTTTTISERASNRIACEALMSRFEAGTITSSPLVLNTISMCQIQFPDL